MSQKVRLSAFYCFLMFMVCVLGCGGAGNNTSVLTLEINGVSWDKEMAGSQRYPQELYFTTITCDSQDGTRAAVKFKFDGVHDFKKGKTYKVTVHQSTGKLISWTETKQKQQKADTINVILTNGKDE